MDAKLINIQVEREIVGMIEAGSIHARISQADGMVRFDTDPEAYRYLVSNQQTNKNKQAGDMVRFDTDPEAYR